MAPYGASFSLVCKHETFQEGPQPVQAVWEVAAAKAEAEVAPARALVMPIHRSWQNQDSAVSHSTLSKCLNGTGSLWPCLAQARSHLRQEGGLQPAGKARDQR